MVFGNNGFWAFDVGLGLGHWIGKNWVGPYGFHIWIFSIDIILEWKVNRYSFLGQLKLFLKKKKEKGKKRKKKKKVS